MNGALEAIGASPVPVHGIPVPAVRATGLVVPMMRELGELGYIFTARTAMDSSRTQSVLGLAPSAWGGHAPPDG